MSPIVSSPVTIAEWQAMLDRIEDAVTAALGDATRRERELIAEPELPALARPSGDEIEARLAGLEERFARARTLAADIETMLANDEREVQSWRETAALARQRLDAVDRL